MAHVFISYAHKDFEFAENLKLRLEKSDFDVWMDEERLRAGEDWRAEIDHAIKNSFAFILVISPISMESKYVMYEWSFALGADKTVVPLLYQEIDQDQVHPRLDKRQYFDFTNRIRPWSELNQRLKDLKRKTEIVEENRNFHFYDEASNDKEMSQLVRALDSPLSDERATALKLLRQMNKIVPSEILLKVVKTDFNWFPKLLAVEMLADMGNPDTVVPLLLALVSEKDTDVKCGIIEALGKIGSATAVPILIDKLSDTARGEIEMYEGTRVCDFAAAALEKIGGHDALEAVKRWRAVDDIPF